MRRLDAERDSFRLQRVVGLAHAVHGKYHFGCPGDLREGAGEHFAVKSREPGRKTTAVQAVSARCVASVSRILRATCRPEINVSAATT